jgi:hypothetical protein
MSRDPMTPNCVRMNAHVREILHENEDLGGPLGKSYTGWSNIYSHYLLGDSSTIGRPSLSSYTVRSWEGLSPRWSQPPKKLYDSPYGAIMFPVQDSPSSPPLNSIEI